jgi:hypothetical protein
VNLEQLNAALTEAELRIQKRKALGSELEGLQRQLARHREHLEVLHSALEDTERDVKALEGGGLTSFVLVLRGEKQARLSKRRDEALGARAEFERLQREYGRVERQVRETTQAYAAMSNAHAERQEAVARKVEHLLANPSEAPAALLATLYQLAEVRSRKLAVETALACKANASGRLYTARKVLGSASAWWTLETPGRAQVLRLAEDAQDQVDEGRRSLEALRAAVWEVLPWDNLGCAKKFDGIAADFQRGFTYQPGAPWRFAPAGAMASLRFALEGVERDLVSALHEAQAEIASLSERIAIGDRIEQSS